MFFKSKSNEILTDGNVIYFVVKCDTTTKNEKWQIRMMPVSQCTDYRDRFTCPVGTLLYDGLTKEDVMNKLSWMASKVGAINLS